MTLEDILSGQVMVGHLLSEQFLRLRYPENQNKYMQTQIHIKTYANEGYIIYSTNIHMFSLKYKEIRKLLWDKTIVNVNCVSRPLTLPI